MLEELFYIHRKTVENIPTVFKRYLYHDIAWDESHICVCGGRGVGKTTMLLQYYREKYNDVEKCLYFSADNVEVTSIGLFNAAKEYFNYGGQALIIDEIHKYQDWQIELKNIIDTFKNKKIMISGSSSIGLGAGKADLSRRVVYYTLKGLSFREYLELKEKISLPACWFGEVIANHVKIAQRIASNHPILKYFKNYLNTGYYPFFIEGERMYLSKVLNIIEKVLYEDIAIIGNIKKSNIGALKKILWLIASSEPFYVNIGKISRDLGLSKEYVYAYLEYLEEAGLIACVKSEGKGHKFIRKPEKLFMENCNLLAVINSSLMFENNQGVMRETFFLNQLRSIVKINLTDKSDFVVDNKYVFEIGGKNKNRRQIKDIENAFIAADRIEIGRGNKIPLYLFGLLY